VFGIGIDSHSKPSLIFEGSAGAYTGLHYKDRLLPIIGDDISIKSSNVKININDVCNLISMSSECFN